MVKKGKGELKKKKMSCLAISTTKESNMNLRYISI